MKLNAQNQVFQQNYIKVKWRINKNKKAKMMRKWKQNRKRLNRFGGLIRIKEQNLLMVYFAWKLDQIISIKNEIDSSIYGQVSQLRIYELCCNFIHKVVHFLFLLYLLIYNHNKMLLNFLKSYLNYLFIYFYYFFKSFIYIFFYCTYHRNIISNYSQIKDRNMRRCITPTPHSKAKYLSELVDISQNFLKTTDVSLQHHNKKGCEYSQFRGNKNNDNQNHGRKINYDSFIYVDRLTNNKIVLGEAKNMYAIKENRHTHINTNNHQSITNSQASPHQNSGNMFSVHGLKENSCSNAFSRMRRPTSQANNRHKQYSQSKQMQQINDCFSIMKSTKMFQMENLKNKLFSKGQQQNNGIQSEEMSSKNKESNQIQVMIKKKKKIRQYIEHYLTNLCLTEFRKYMQPETEKEKQKVKFINPNILNIHKTMSNKINKQNVEKIIEQFLLSENTQEKKKIEISPTLDCISFPGEARLKQLLMHRMFIKNKQFQYLVSPTHKNQVQSWIHDQTRNIKSSCPNQKATINESRVLNQKASVQNKYNSEVNIKDYHFNQFCEKDLQKIKQSLKKTTQRPSGGENKNKQKMMKNLEQKKKQLLLSIQTGSICDMLFLIIRWPILLNYKDKMGNNLLHISAKHNQPQIYNILVKKLGLEQIKQKNNVTIPYISQRGKSSIQLAELFGSIEVQKINQEFKKSL